MKKRILCTALAMLTLVAAAGCGPADEPAPSASPAPLTTPGNSPAAPMTPNVTITPGTTAAPGGDVIEGFKEGGAVEVDKLPTKVLDAIKGRYSEASIKSASYVTYETKQVYKVVIEKPEDKTSEEIYVTPGGEIIPAKAGASPAAPSSGSKVPPTPETKK